jgi:hypothetical protein
VRYTFPVVAAGLLAGCAGSPPQPPLPAGEYRPINIPAAPALRDVFEFVYAGDILGALPALAKVAPIKVMPTLGKATPLPVRLDLQGVRLEQALRAIGAQGGGVADVVWHATLNRGGNQVFIRFRAPAEVEAVGTRRETE